MESVHRFSMTRRFFAVIATALVVSACSDNSSDTSSGGGSGDANAGTGSQNLAQTAIDAAPEFTTLVSSLRAAGLIPTLSQGGPFTVFAPTNAAFARVQGTIDAMNAAQMISILNYHVVPGITGADGIPSTSGATPQIGTAILASNGVIFPVSEVLLP